MRTTLCAAFASIAAALRTTHRRALLLSPASLYPFAARAEPLPAGRKELYALVCAAAWVLNRTAGGVADDGDAAFLLTTRVKRPLLRVLAPSPAPPETRRPSPAAALPPSPDSHVAARSADARRQLDPVPGSAYKSNGRRVDVTG